jgi:hypothetical protein
VSEKEVNVHVDVSMYCTVTSIPKLRLYVAFKYLVDSCIVQHKDRNAGPGIRSEEV